MVCSYLSQLHYTPKSNYNAAGSQAAAEDRRRLPTKYTLDEGYYEFLLQAVHRRHPLDRAGRRHSCLPLSNGRYGDSERRAIDGARFAGGGVREPRPDRGRFRTRLIYALYQYAAHSDVSAELG